MGQGTDANWDEAVVRTGVPNCRLMSKAALLLGRVGGGGGDCYAAYARHGDVSGLRSFFLVGQ